MQFKQLLKKKHHLRLNHSVIAFIIVVASHGLAVFALAQIENSDTIINITDVASVPVIQGALLSAPMPIAKPEEGIPPKPKKEKLKKVIKEKVENQFESEKKLDPIANENAITSQQEQPAPAEAIAPEPQPEPQQEPQPEPVVIPPRIEAHNLDNQPPTYPRISRRLNESGTVVLEIFILPNGRVGEVRLKTSSGFERLDNAALMTVKHWLFTPAKRGDIAIGYWYLQPVTFTLH